MNADPLIARRNGVRISASALDFTADDAGDAGDDPNAKTLADIAAAIGLTGDDAENPDTILARVRALVKEAGPAAAARIAASRASTGGKSTMLADKMKAEAKRLETQGYKS